jgi:3,4-dihydroxy 2-butanone 4-phosphate synthase/GTP cyclohydrolase II
MMRLPALREFADEHGLALISIEQLIEHRRRTERLVTRVAETVIPNAYGEWRAYGYRSDIDGAEHLALVLGNVGAVDGDDNGGEDVLVRVHSECLTGDVFGSERCDCGAQLEASMAKIAERGRGVVLYLRGHEGRGIGLLSKLQAYELQDAGADTVDANLRLGLPVDAREYSVAAQLLDDLGVRSVRLLTNNPAKVDALASHGFDVFRVPLPPLTTPYNLRYHHQTRPSRPSARNPGNTTTASGRGLLTDAGPPLSSSGSSRTSGSPRSARPPRHNFARGLITARSAKPKRTPKDSGWLTAP